MARSSTFLIYGVVAAAVAATAYAVRAARAQERERNAIRGHTGPVLCVCIVGDGTDRVVSGSADGILRVWLVNVGKKQKEGDGTPLVSHAGAVTCVCSVPGTSLVVSGGDDGHVRVWDVGANKRLVATMSTTGHVGCVRALVALADGRVVSCGDDRTIRVWDVHATRSCVFTLENAHNGAITCVAAMKDPSQIVTGSEDRTLKVWDVVAQRAVATWGTPTDLPEDYQGSACPGHTGAVTCVMVYADNGYAFSGSTDGTLKSWKPDSIGHSSVEYCYNLQHPTCALMLQGTVWVASGDKTTHQLTIWNAGYMPNSVRCDGHTAAITCVAQQSDGTIVSGSEDGSLRLWRFDPTVV